MTRTLYSIAWWIALPLVLLRLCWRGRLEPGYRAYWLERLGFYARKGNNAGLRKNLFWIHAVSVGETRAAEPLIHALLAAYPDHSILLTHMTPTGRAAGAALFGQLGARVEQSYLPYDTGWMTARFLKHFAPRLGLLMETEVWPNLIAQCVRQRVPLAMINARLSERSLRKAQRLSGLMGEAAQGLTCVAAQTDEDAARIRTMGAKNVQVTGSVKFDVAPPPAALAAGAVLRAKLGARGVLLCASTREGEEELILNAFAARPSGMEGMLLMIVPRHPQRFDEVALMIEGKGLRLRRRSTLTNGSEHDGLQGDVSANISGAMPGTVSADTQVILGDSMGEMFAYYAACDVAFIGGSLLPLGGQNLIEACAVGKPVLVGPHTFNFESATAEALRAGAALRVPDAATMLEAAGRLLADDPTRTAMSEHARAFAAQHGGATARIMDLLRPLIERD